VTLNLPLTQELRPALMLKCAAVGSFDTDTITVSQPKSALALGGSIRGSFAQGLEQARARGTAAGAAGF
jgi:hypothetical protein